MDALLTTLAESSPVAVVAIYALWRISVVMIALSNALVTIATQQSDSVTDLVDKQATN